MKKFRKLSKLIYFFINKKHFEKKKKKFEILFKQNNIVNIILQFSDIKFLL